MSGRDVRSLLYDGERIEHDVDVGAGRVVVTSHRVLAFGTVTGANYRHVDRPNVEGVGVVTESARRHVLYAVSFLVLAAPIYYFSTVLNFDDVFAGLQTNGEAIGLGGVGGLVDTLGTLFGLIDDGLFWMAVLFAVVAVAFLGLYVYSRTRVLRLDVAGGADLRVEVGGADGVDDVVRELRAALGFADGAGVANTAAGTGGGAVPGTTGSTGTDSRTTTPATGDGGSGPGAGGGPDSESESGGDGGPVFD